MEQMKHWEDYSEEDRTLLETTNYFEELVESIDKFKENSGSFSSKHGLESAANVQERERVSNMVEMITERMERAEDENDIL